MTRVLRFTFLFLAVTSAVVAVQATLSPHGFYTGFPVGLSWVDYLPPYNEHLIRDVGSFYVAFTILFVWSAVTLARALIVPVSVAWAVAAAMHAVFHVLHLGNFDTGDAIAQTIVLFAVVALPLLVIVLSARDVRHLRA